MGVTTKSIKRQIALNMVFTPWAYYPAGGGLAALLTNFFFVPSPMLVFGGLVSLAFAGFAVAWRWIANFDSVIEESYEKEVARLAQEKEQQLDALISLFEDTYDSDAKRLLKDLRNLYEEFHRVISDDSTNFVNSEIVKRVETLFTASIGCLKAANTNLTASKRMRLTNVKSQFINRREEYIAQVENSIETLGRSVGEIANLTFSQDHTALNRLAQELDDNLDVARRVQERLDQTDDQISSSE